MVSDNNVLLEALLRSLVTLAEIVSIEKLIQQISLFPVSWQQILLPKYIIPPLIILTKHSCAADNHSDNASNLM